MERLNRIKFESTMDLHTPDPTGRRNPPCIPISDIGRIRFCWVEKSTRRLQASLKFPTRIEMRVPLISIAGPGISMVWRLV